MATFGRRMTRCKLDDALVGIKQGVYESSARRNWRGLNGGQEHAGADRRKDGRQSGAPRGESVRLLSNRGAGRTH